MTDKREQDALVAFIGGTSRTLEQWLEFARRDDCLDKMVPSDLRALLGALSRALTRPASGDAVEAGANALLAFDYPTGGVRLPQHELDTITNRQGVDAVYRKAAQNYRAKAAAVLEAATLTTEAPAQTGFVYSETPSDDTQDLLPITDITQAQSEAMALADELEAKLRAARSTKLLGIDPVFADRILATLRQPASVEAEPVAWRCRSLFLRDGKVKHGDWFLQFVEGENTAPQQGMAGEESQPLYAHPPADAEIERRDKLLREVHDEYGHRLPTPLVNSIASALAADTGEGCGL